MTTEEDLSEEDERTERGSGSSTSYGYTVEWRLLPESVALADVMPFSAHGPGKKWGQGPYQVSDLGRMSDRASSTVQPRPEKYDWGLSERGLVTRKVAIAIISCLQTSVDERLLKHVEWRIVRVRLETSYKMVLDEDDKEKEEHMNQIRNILAGHPAAVGGD